MAKVLNFTEELALMANRGLLKKANVSFFNGESYDFEDFQEPLVFNKLNKAQQLTFLFQVLIFQANVYNNSEEALQAYKPLMERFDRNWIERNEKLLFEIFKEDLFRIKKEANNKEDIIREFGSKKYILNTVESLNNNYNANIDVSFESYLTFVA